MTRAALRILNQARSSAWRRVGIPEVWPDNATKHPSSNGQKVADEAAKEQETTRSEEPPADVTPDKDEK